MVTVPLNAALSGFRWSWNPQLERFPDRVAVNDSPGFSIGPLSSGQSPWVGCGSDDMWCGLESSLTNFSCAPAASVSAWLETPAEVSLISIADDPPPFVSSEGCS